MSTTRLSYGKQVANAEMMQKQKINATLITATEKHTKSKKECVCVGGGAKIFLYASDLRSVVGRISVFFVNLQHFSLAGVCLISVKSA